MNEIFKQRAAATDDEQARSSRTITIVVYVLQACGFVNGLTFIVAVIINYVKRLDVQGSWLESHFLWQIRTFWFGLIWAVIGFLALLTFVGAIVGIPVLIANAIWMIYRIVKGFLRLLDGKEMYVSPNEG